MVYTKEDKGTDKKWLMSHGVDRLEANHFIQYIVKKCLEDKKTLKKQTRFLEKKTGSVGKPDYKKAYEILIEYFDSISDEEKPKVDKELKKVGL